MLSCQSARYHPSAAPPPFCLARMLRRSCTHSATLPACGPVLGDTDKITLNWSPSPPKLLRPRATYLWKIPTTLESFAAVELFWTKRSRFFQSNYKRAFRAFIELWYVQIWSGTAGCEVTASRMVRVHAHAVSHTLTPICTSEDTRRSPWA